MMPISIYNTKTKKKDVFVPLNPGQVSMYVCGVTVYDDCHLGHARSALTFDMIRRYFRIFWLPGDLRQELHRYRRQNLKQGSARKYPLERHQ